MDPSGYCKKSAGDYLNELWENIKEKLKSAPFYYLKYSVLDTSNSLIGIPVGVGNSSMYANYPATKTTIVVVEKIKGDVVDEVIEVAGDYLAPEDLEKTSDVFGNIADFYEEEVVPLKAAASFMGTVTLLSVELWGTTLEFGTPSLGTPEGWIVESGVAVSGSVIVATEGLITAALSTAACGSQSNANKASDISNKLHDKAEEKKVEYRFPQNPDDFNPKGLTRRDFNTQNGKIYKWFDQNGNAVYEWNEDLLHGSHYHKIGSDGNTRIPGANGETHFWPGEMIE